MPKQTHSYTPDPELLSHFPAISGNDVNGLGERDPRRPAKFFWHPAAEHEFGELQTFIVSNFRPQSGEDRSFRNPAVDRGPEPVPLAGRQVEKEPDEWTRIVKNRALEDEADLVGIAAMKPEYVFEGYEIKERWVILFGIAHDYARLKKAPARDGDLDPYYDLHDQYNRGARVAARMRNFIREQGHEASAWLGPMASALLMIPPAIEAGMGELGKHGSLINRQYGSGFRLSAVTTDLPLVADKPDVFGADDFCRNCRVCADACPPAAILPQKQWVRGTRKWYVDFDKCIPYFGENYACGICIAVCPWTRPGVAARLIEKLARRKNAAQNAGR